MSNRFAQFLQLESLRAPEVLIGAEWDTKAIFGTRQQGKPIVQQVRDYSCDRVGPASSYEKCSVVS